MVFDHAVSDVVKEGGFAGAGRGDDEAAGSFADGAKEIHDAGGEAGVVGFKKEVLTRRNGGHLLEGETTLAFIERQPIHCFNEADFGIWKFWVMKGFGDDCITCLELKAFNKFTRNEGVIGGRFSVAGRFEQLTGLIGKDLQKTGDRDFIILRCIFFVTH